MKKITLIILSLVLLMSAVCCSSNPVEPPEVSVKAVLDFSKVELMKGDRIYFTAEWQFKGKTMCHEVDFTVEDTGIKTREVAFKPRKVAGSMKVSVIRPFDTVTKDTSEGYLVAESYLEVGEYTAEESYTVQVKSVDDYLTFTGMEVTVTPNGWVGEKLEYSADGGQWKAISNGSKAEAAYIIKFRGTGGIKCSGEDYSGGNWSIDSKSGVSVSGDIMTVLDYQKPPAKISCEGCFEFMFGNQYAIVDASGLKLSATTLSKKCYCAMFCNCPLMIAAPSLPATVLAEECYYDMFDSCRGLKTAPALPATVLAKECYEAMFACCVNLTTLTIPEGKDSALPAKELKEGCYSSMFAGCQSLKVSTSGEDSQKIFKCPSTSDLSYPVEGMFYGTSGTFQDDPIEGETYYWY